MKQNISTRQRIIWWLVMNSIIVLSIIGACTLSTGCHAVRGGVNGFAVDVQGWTAERGGD